MKRISIFLATLSIICLGVNATPAQAVPDGDISCSVSGYFKVRGNMVVTKTRAEATELSKCVGTAVIPKGVTAIADYGFNGENLMTRIAIPDSVTTIASNGLAETGLKRIIIPPFVTTFGSGAFAFNYDLTSVIIPASVTSIDYNAFWGASGLTKIYFLGAIAPKTNDAAFHGISPAAIAYVVDNATGFAPNGQIWKDLTVSTGGSLILYDANGADSGSAPEDSTVYAQGAAVATLGNTGSLARTGYSFQGWSLSQDGSGCPVSASSQFAAPAGISLLYATWHGNPAVTYCSNGSESGSAPIDNTSPYASGSSVTVLDNSGALEVAGYTFAGWNTKADGSGTDRAVSSAFTIGNDDVVLYAKWISKNPPKPSPTPSASGSPTGTATASSTPSASASPSSSASATGTPSASASDSADTGGATVDTSFNNSGDTAPALVQPADLTKRSDVSFGADYQFQIDPNGKVTPKIKSVYVGTMSFELSLSDESKSFSLVTCPAKRYRDKAHKVCVAPKTVTSSTCTLLQTKEKVGHALKTRQPWEFESCQLNQSGRDKLKANPAANRPKLILHLSYNRMFPQNGKNKVTLNGHNYTVSRWKRTYVISFS